MYSLATTPSALEAVMRLNQLEIRYREHAARSPLRGKSPRSIGAYIGIYVAFVIVVGGIICGIFTTITHSLAIRLSAPAILASLPLFIGGIYGLHRLRLYRALRRQRANVERLRTRGKILSVNDQLIQFWAHLNAAYGIGPEVQETWPEQFYEAFSLAQDRYNLLHQANEEQSHQLRHQAGQILQEAFIRVAAQLDYQREVDHRLAQDIRTARQIEFDERVRLMLESPR